MKVPFINFAPQMAESKKELLAVTEKVLDSGQYILGPEVAAFEREFAAFCGARHAIGVSNGTDALILALKALGIGPGDEVITAPNSFVASASTIALVGARPVFADVLDDLNIDPAAIERAITPRTKAIMPVHLTGRPARMPEIMAIAKKRGLYVVEDAAQAAGAKIGGQRVGTFGDVGCFSMHPLKNLRACGDAGMITTQSDKLDDYLRVARNLGLRTREDCEFWSPNNRLDELQAALLRVGLRSLEHWTDVRRRIVEHYNRELKGCVSVPEDGAGEHGVYQVYVIQARRRDELQAHLLARGVDTRIHYRTPIHLQTAARGLGHKAGDFPRTEAACERILSLPVWPGMTMEQQALVVQGIREFYA